MAFSIIDATGPVISAKISGELDKTEVGRIQAAALQAIRRCGRISALLILDDFQGWKLSDDWGDITFMTEHDQDMARIAVVGEEQWRDLSTRFLPKDFAPPRSSIFFPMISPRRRAGSKRIRDDRHDDTRGSESAAAKQGSDALRRFAEVQTWKSRLD